MVERLPGGARYDAARGPDPVQRRLAKLISPVRERADESEVRFVADVIRGNLRLLLGMVRANRPWELIADAL